MLARLTILFGLCAVGHVALDGLVASPWLVPDLTLVGMVLIIVHAPSTWWAAALGAGVLAGTWAVRAPHAVLAVHVAAGWGLALLSRHWDVTDTRLQGWLVGALSLGVTGALMGLDGSWSWGLAVRLLVRMALTVGAWAVARPLAIRFLPT